MIRNVVGYEGRYVVDDEGNVFSVRSNRYLASIKMKRVDVCDECFAKLAVLIQHSELIEPKEG